MSFSKFQRVLKMRLLIAFSATTAFIVPVNAGTLAFQAGSWGSLTGSGSSDSTAYTEYSASDGTMSPSLTLTSPASGDSYTLGGTYSFSVKWTPSGSTDTAPSSVTLNFEKMVSLNANGTGVAEILSGSTILSEMDSTNNIPKGGQMFLSAVTVTVSLTANGDGTYGGSGSVTTDTLSTTYNSGGSGVTTATEIFNMDSMVGNS